MSSDLPPYAYEGARAMVHLHEDHLREFVRLWRSAQAVGLQLPETADPDYRSLDHLLLHVLGCARGYLRWMCENLGLEDPRMDEPPAVDRIAQEAEAYLDHVLDRWRRPLAGVDEERFGHPEYKSRWGVLYCIDAMLEHAVMHPIRHGFQLRRLMEGASGRA